jgi:hypothetical protein
MESLYDELNFINTSYSILFDGSGSATPRVGHPICLDDVEHAAVETPARIQTRLPEQRLQELRTREDHIVRIRLGTAVLEGLEDQ